MTSDVTKSPLSGASLVLRLTEVRSFRPTATVKKEEIESERWRHELDS